MSQQTITLLFLVFTIISFILEKIPLGLTASICAIGLTLTGVVDVSTTFSQYVNSNVILCVGMFVVGQALFESGKVELDEDYVKIRDIYQGIYKIFQAEAEKKGIHLKIRWNAMSSMST